MSSRIKANWLAAVVAFVLVAHAVFAEPPPAGSASESEASPPLETLVREAQAITDAVLYLRRIRSANV